MSQTSAGAPPHGNVIPIPCDALHSIPHRRAIPWIHPRGKATAAKDAEREARERPPAPRGPGRCARPPCGCEPDGTRRTRGRPAAPAPPGGRRRPGGAGPARPRGGRPASGRWPAGGTAPSAEMAPLRRGGAALERRMTGAERFRRRGPLLEIAPGCWISAAGVTAILPADPATGADGLAVVEADGRPYVVRPAPAAVAQAVADALLAWA